MTTWSYARRTSTTMFPRVAFEYGQTSCARMDECFSLRARQLWHLDNKLDGQAKALTNRTDRDVRGHLHGTGLDLLHASEMRDGTAKARRVTGREQLLGIRTSGATATKRAGRHEGEVERAVARMDATLAASNSRCGCGVEALIENRWLVRHARNLRTRSIARNSIAHDLIATQRPSHRLASDYAYKASICAAYFAAIGLRLSFIVGVSSSPPGIHSSGSSA